MSVEDSLLLEFTSKFSFSLLFSFIFIDIHIGRWSEKKALPLWVKILLLWKSAQSIIVYHLLIILVIHFRWITISISNLLQGGNANQILPSLCHCPLWLAQVTGGNNRRKINKQSTTKVTSDMSSKLFPCSPLNKRLYKKDIKQFENVIMVILWSYHPAPPASMRSWWAYWVWPWHSFNNSF